nr:histidine phosphatase family protein [uncultured Sphingomonas sp.]
MSRLVLVRHGQSIWNAERRLQGQADPPLSSLGAAQARGLAPQLRALRIARSFCSDLQRARQTAELTGLAAKPDPLWREIDVGEWAGRNVGDLRDQEPALWRRWRAGEHTPPGGEPWSHFSGRITQALDSLPDEDVIVVTHGGVVRAAVALLLEISPDLLAPTPPASITIVERGNWPRLRGYGISLDLGRDAPD